ncbi:MAG: PASTA domain-containing protein [Methanosarcinaceae archaeon]|nr:PASTA domain-containing protein [Methanosarcinaceae archaeon]MDD4331607.1 PASTA domain-containing protein [Methanosarcinaceae archaeon]
MKAKLEHRLEELEAEYTTGQKLLKDIENTLQELQNKKENLEETLLRICGAIDLLEELLKSPDAKEETKTSKAKVGKEKEQLAIKASEEVEVPKLIKKSVKIAKEMLEASGLEVGHISEKPIFVSGVNFGEVIRQKPKPGEKVSPGTAVDLVLATKGRFKPNLGKNSRFGAFCTH